MSEHQKQLDRAKLELMTNKDMAFITTVCFSMKHEWDDSISTACTNGVFIKYNTAYWLDKDADQQLFMVLHETWHVAFAHMGRLQGRNMRAWNVAADYVITLCWCHSDARCRKVVSTTASTQVCPRKKSTS